MPKTARLSLGEPRRHRRPCLGVDAGEEGIDRLGPECGVEQQVELPIEPRGQGRGEVRQRFDAARDLGGTTIAVSHHALDPARVRRPPAHHARDLLGHGARARRIGARSVEVVERRHLPKTRRCGGEAALVRGVLRAVEQVDLRVVLDVNERFGVADARGESVFIGGAVEPEAVRAG